MDAIPESITWMSASASDSLAWLAEFIVPLTLAEGWTETMLWPLPANSRYTAWKSATEG